MKYRFFTSCFLAALISLTGCNRHSATLWTPEQLSPRHYNTILVAAIVPGNDSMVRKETEAGFVQQFRSLGYNALSAYSSFGPNGLADMREEETYLRLCGQGIDAVFTIALLPKNSQGKISQLRAGLQSNSYYYHRILNYNHYLEGLRPVTGSAYFSECILFDLALLQATCIIQSPSFTWKGNRQQDLALRTARLMKNKKLLRRQPEAGRAF